MKYFLIGLFFVFIASSCTPPTTSEVILSVNEPDTDVFVQVLGIAQDAGYPQAGCQKACCSAFHKGTIAPKLTSCVAVIDQTAQTYWMIDATPDFKEQYQILQSSYPGFTFGGIFLTHAHVGHYAGLIHLGREIMGTKAVPVFAMPKMADFLRNNGPWSQLVALNNIELIPLRSDSTIVLNKRLAITPQQVPHRDEYSETVGYKVTGQEASLLFIPDIDKWNKWNRNILDEIKKVDHALLDGSFYKNGEIPGRDMSLIPHPFMEESLELMKNLEQEDRMKIKFTHFNHTNPVLDFRSEAHQTVLDTGIGIAKEGDKMAL